MELAALCVHVVLVHLVREHEQAVRVRELDDGLDVGAGQHLEVRGYTQLII